MPYNYFKEIKFRCNICKDVVISKSESEWSECSCGDLHVLGKNSFVKVSGTNYADLCSFNTENLPNIIEPTPNN